MTNIKRIHNRIHKHMTTHLTTILKYAVLVLSVTLTATLQAETDPKQSYAQKLSKSQIECLSKAAYHEAKGESDNGMLAVIHTTLNRVKDNRFPKTVCGVVYQKSQYSWTKYNPKVKEQEQYARAERLAKEVIDGKHKDNTYGALFFNSLHRKPSGTVCTVRIGGHSFYKPIK